MTKPTKIQIIFLAVFILLSILASNINFTPFVVGKLKFTLFDLYAPIAGGFFGPVVGPGIILVVEIINLLLRQTFTLAGFLHLFPVMFGAWYFGTNRKLVNLVPILAIIGFVASPIGREVWYYSLFWVIPLVASLFKQQSIIARALGATFTAHAVGGLFWIYAFQPPAAVWINLIPIVIMERLVFTVSSAVIYVAVKKLVLDKLQIVSEQLTHAVRQD